MFETAARPAKGTYVPNDFEAESQKKSRRHGATEKRTSKFSHSRTGRNNLEKLNGQGQTWCTRVLKGKKTTRLRHIKTLVFMPETRKTRA